MTEPGLGTAIAAHYERQRAAARTRPFQPDPALEALSTRLSDMRNIAPSNYQAHPDRERVERYEMRKADHARQYAPETVVGVNGPGGDAA